LWRSRLFQTERWSHDPRPRIAKTIDVPPRRINEIVHGKRGLSADTALRLSRALGLSDRFWINMQARYDAEIAREHFAKQLATIECIA
jgi:antitoxin HigA-1